MSFPLIHPLNSYLNFYPLGESKSLSFSPSLIFGTENAIIDPPLRRREKDTRANNNLFISFHFHILFLFLPLFLSLSTISLPLFFNIAVILCRLKKAPNWGLLAHILQHRIPHEKHGNSTRVFIVFHYIYKYSRDRAILLFVFFL